MSYDSLLKRTEWQKRRLYIFERDNFKCQAGGCKTPDSNLEVHHIDYLSYELEPWKYPDDMLITLCNVCHKKEQTRPRAENDFITALKMKGFLMGDLVCLTTLLYTSDTFTKRLLKNLRDIQNG